MLPPQFSFISICNLKERLYGLKNTEKTAVRKIKELRKALQVHESTEKTRYIAHYHWLSENFANDC